MDVDFNGLPESFCPESTEYREYGGEKNMENLLVWGFYFLTLYAFLPGLVSRMFGFRVFKKGLTEREIALTFDDGPDPVYTPKLLDLLARHGAKATFFVVGSHAERHPELLQRMRDEGHTIGIHNYVHKTNWLMRPATVRKQIQRTAEIIEAAAGLKPAYYRPPWGIVNLFDFSKKGQYKIVLWSGIFGDWKAHDNADRLTERLLKKLRPGEVVLLHDCGLTLGADAQAPTQMLEALTVYLEEGIRRGFRFVGIEEMMAITDKAKEARPGLIGRAAAWTWLQYEKLFHLVFRLKAVRGSGDRTVFYYRKTTYNGPEVEMKEGDIIRKGDSVAEIHLDNDMLRRVSGRSTSPMAVIIHLIREMETALPSLSRQVLNDPETSSVKAIYGVTMIHRGTDRLGFQVFDLPENLFAKASRIYLRILFRVLTARPKKKASSRKGKERDKKPMTPRMLLMSREDILRHAARMPSSSRDADGQEAARQPKGSVTVPAAEPGASVEPVASGSPSAS